MQKRAQFIFTSSCAEAYVIVCERILVNSSVCSSISTVTVNPILQSILSFLAPGGTTASKW